MFPSNLWLSSSFAVNWLHLWWFYINRFVLVIMTMIKSNWYLPVYVLYTKPWRASSFNKWFGGRQSRSLNSWKLAVYNSTIVQNVVTSWNSHDRSSWYLYEYNQRIDRRCWIHYLMLSSQDHIVVFSEVDSNSSNKYNTCTSFFVICVINCMNSSDAVPAFSTLFIFL